MHGYEFYNRNARVNIEELRRRFPKRRSPDRHVSFAVHRQLREGTSLSNMS
jgi:hypothetical protein